MTRLAVQLWSVATAALLLSSPVQGAEPVLFENKSIAITAEDIRADAVRMPAEMRSAVLSRPETVTQIASNLFARRALAERAESEGLHKDPAVAAALRVARDKVLSDAMLEKIDKAHAPSDALLESMARDVYKAKPERFKQPEQVRVRHILIAGQQPSSRAQAEKVLEELKAGADFAQLAKDRSADTGSAAKGGDLGVFAKGRMVPEFELAAFALKAPGDLSDIVTTQFGYHILQLQERLPVGMRSFAEVHDELIKEARTTVTQDARVAEAEKLQRGVTIHKEAIDAFAASNKSGK